MLCEMELLLAGAVDINGRGHGGRTALHTAAGLGLTRSVDFLVKAGADLNLLDENQLTPLMNACSLGKLKGGRVAMRLIAAGADVNYVRTSDEMTALKFAACEGRPELIEALLERGAEVDGPEGTDQTALMLAARYNNVDALRVLVEHGADWKRPCGLPWARGKSAEQLAEMERRRKALAFLRSLRTGKPSI
jgi:ankyrin repeat protein